MHFISYTISKLLQGHSEVEPIDSRNLNFFTKLGAEYNLITNWKIDRETFEEYPFSIVLKLYEPLSDEIEENEQLEIVQLLSSPIVEKVQLVGTQTQH